MNNSVRLPAKHSKRCWMIKMNNILTLGKSCCGCGGCEQACPRHCISFITDEEGFLYPSVDANACTDCGVCLKKCPIASDVPRGKDPAVYAAKLNDRQTAFQSTSGGVFYAIAADFLARGGVVFGCAYDDDLRAVHIAAHNERELKRLQGSKYVQSDTRGVYRRVKEALDQSKPVLFSGTGCQAAGLRAFLGREYDNLLIADIVCHGVPSPLLFEKYLQYKGGKMGGKITAYNFRSKAKRGWDLYYMAETTRKKQSDYGFFDPYYNAFLNCKTYRESCYQCPFANSERPGDITLADYWGVQKAHPEFYDSNGVSLVLVNTPKGEAAWEKLRKVTTSVPSTLEQAVVLNKNLREPSARPDCRDTIYEGIDGDIDEYFSSKLAFKTNPKTRLKKMIPTGLKDTIKKIKS